MRAWQLDDCSIDRLSVVERPQPRPGRGQVLVRLRAASLNYRDLLMIQGLYNPKRPGGQVALSDGAGEVIAVGPGVTRVKPGDRVCGAFCQKWVSGTPTREKLRATLGGPLDGMLAEQGLKPAAGAKLPYELPAANFARAVDEGPHLAALAAWFAAGAELLEALRKKHKRFKPGPGPIRCWPHHFDIATVIELEDPKKKNARSIGIGLSPGDDYYAQPYFYLSPYPRPDTESLPELPAGGRWHTREFFGAVVTGVDMLAHADPRAGLLGVLDAAFAESVKRLGSRP